MFMHPTVDALGISMHMLNISHRAYASPVTRRTPPFTQVPMPVPSINDAPSSYGDVMIFAPTPQPVIQTAITHTDAHSHSGVENFYDNQHQDNVNSQDSRARFLEDYLIARYIALHGQRHALASLDRY
ncbi:hypothetical protein F5146DRAFT_1146191 [Armillaria mellea]|nr:hypothetical protein F5146DRAFT_1146191 [Armillaria mellea]